MPTTASPSAQGRAPAAPSLGAPDAERLIDVRGLSKTFELGLFKKRRVEAVKGVTFDVRRGEIFGFLGPNGAGKTTTIKMLTGLIAPTSGEAFLFGERVPSPAARASLGFLPENPYVYPYLTPREFVELSGRLSKGMLQRTGLAAALVSDPQMLILDEPMSGLDPVGRKEVKDLIFAERDRGRTVFFSTHILSDVEAMCDRVAILREGEVVVSGALRDLLRGDVMRTEVTLAGASEALEARLREAGHAVHHRPGVLLVDLEGEEHVGGVLTLSLAHGARVLEVVPRRETLEDLFLRRAL